ncbi:hypothetical protein HK101_006331, partial [Irineochytrium annulatum]
IERAQTASRRHKRKPKASAASAPVTTFAILPPKVNLGAPATTERKWSASGLFRSQSQKHRAPPLPKPVKIPPRDDNFNYFGPRVVVSLPRPGTAEKKAEEDAEGVGMRSLSMSSSPAVIQTPSTTTAGPATESPVMTISPTTDGDFQDVGMKAPLTPPPRFNSVRAIYGDEDARILEIRKEVESLMGGGHANFHMLPHPEKAATVAGF